MVSNIQASLVRESVQPRSPETLFEQINNIMNRKSKHTSVAAVVEDKKERSGLTAYLNQISKQSDNAETNETTNKKVAQDQEMDQLLSNFKDAVKGGKWFEAGNIMGKIDKRDGNPRVNAVESIRTMKYFKDPEVSATKIPTAQWKMYTLGYGEGANLSMDDKIKDEQFTLNVLQNIKSKKIASDNNQAIDKKIEMTPIAIQKYPAIAQTLENCIRDTKGNLSVPAIIGRIRSIHQNDVSDAKDWDDDKLTLLVSKLNLDAKQNNPGNYQQYQNLGSRDVGADNEIDPSNTDAFHALTPAR